MTDLRTKKTPSWLRRNVAVFLTVEGLLSAAKAIPHAILTPLLMAKGLSLSDIAILQAVYSGVILVVEFPSGVLADLISRKKLFLYSKVVLAGFFAVAMLGNGMGWMCLAWVLYAVSSALDSGTIDSDIVNALKDHSVDDARVEVSRLVRRDNQVVLASMLAASLVGSWLYLKIGYSIYIVSIGLAIVASLAIARYFQVCSEECASGETGGAALPPPNGAAGWSTVKDQAFDGFREISKSSELQLFLMLSLATQVFFQCHFQFWQAFFIAKRIPVGRLGLLYAAFQMIGVLVSHLSTDSWGFRGLRVRVFIAAPLLILLAMAAAQIENWLSLFPYMIFVGIFWILVNHANSEYRRYVSKKNISTLTSLGSSVSRVGAVFTLLVVSRFISRYSPEWVIIGGFIVAVSLVLGAVASMVSDEHGSVLRRAHRGSW
ncbi:hypothetical protein [Luteococcus sp.]|uniref:hypothetical protein n=1 Tax=Luteococcus sp. TaxID=1969402 RepID=UPI0037369490